MLQATPNFEDTTVCLWFTLVCVEAFIETSQWWIHSQGNCGEVCFSARIQVEGRLPLQPGYSRLCSLWIDVLNSSYVYFSNLFFSIHFDFRIRSCFIWFGPGIGRQAFGQGSGASCSVTILSMTIKLHQAVAYPFNWQKYSSLTHSTTLSPCYSRSLNICLPLGFNNPFVSFHSKICHVVWVLEWLSNPPVFPFLSNFLGDSKELWTLELPPFLPFSKFTNDPPYLIEFLAQRATIHSPEILYLLPMATFLVYL